MHKFGVWAPIPKSVEVLVNGRRQPLVCGENGWWTAEVPDAGPGTDYRFIVDAGDPVPDPRSQFQPEGVNGPSRIVDHASFVWTDRFWQARPLSSAIIYELHVGTFTPDGTFLSTIDKLDYLVDLGVTHVEIMPVNEFSGKWGWGYDGVDLFAPHHAYGTADEFKTLINTCHEKGLAVILDVVYNHFGPAGNYVGRFGPYLTDAYQTPWGSAVNLDHQGSHEVRRFFADNAIMWLRDYHIDGLRLDAVHAFVDKSAMHFLEFLASEVSDLSAALGRHLVLIAESDLNDPRIVGSREIYGYGIDAQWCDDFHHCVHTVLTGENSGYYEEFGDLQQLAKALTNAYVFDGIYSPHRDRLHGRTPHGLSGHHFVVAIQNHDQVGNRAQGERFTHLASTGKQKIAAALLLTSPYVPMVFQGEEFSASTPFQYFSQHEDRQLAESVTKGRTNEFRAFGWDPEEVPDPQDPETFRRSKLRWDEVGEEPHASMLAWYKRLIQLRRSTPSLMDGCREHVQVEFEPEEQWLTMRRGAVQVVVNFSGERRQIPTAFEAEEVVSSEPNAVAGDQQIDMPRECVAILLASETSVPESRSAHGRKNRLVFAHSG